MCTFYGGRLWFKCPCGTWQKCPLYGVSALEGFCYKGFLRNTSGTKFFVRLREVSALEDVHFREVPLYKKVNFYSMNIIHQFNPVVRHVTFLYHLKTWKCNIGKKWVTTTDPLILKAVVWFALRIYWVVSILMQIKLQYYIYSHTKM